MGYALLVLAAIELTAMVAAVVASVLLLSGFVSTARRLFVVDLAIILAGTAVVSAVVIILALV